MLSLNLNKKGVVLFMVLGTLLVAIILANVVLAIISSQSRLTHHQVSRIQAYYAAQAGMNYALEQLRTGNWVAGTDCPDSSPCTPSFRAGDFKPDSIVGNNVSIVIRPFGSSGCTNSPGSTACLSVTANYAYTPSP